MKILYCPTGRAQEYSELACNLYSNCAFGCLYCYCPAILRKSLKEWSENPKPRKDVLKLLEKDCINATPEIKEKELLLSFMCDPYQNAEAAELTSKALSILFYYGFKKVNILTKNPAAIGDDITYFLNNKGWKIGSTIIFRDEKLREFWEPGAPSIESRINAIKELHKLGIYTWVSIEPVVNPFEALYVIKELMNHVDFFKVGKLNHMKEVESKIDWHDFYIQVEELLKNKPHLIKKDLLKYA